MVNGYGPATIADVRVQLASVLDLLIGVMAMHDLPHDDAEAVHVHLCTSSTVGRYFTGRLLASTPSHLSLSLSLSLPLSLYLCLSLWLSPSYLHTIGTLWASCRRPHLPPTFLVLESMNLARRRKSPLPAQVRATTWIRCFLSFAAYSYRSIMLWIC